jgi:hypothetical protein
VNIILSKLDYKIYIVHYHRELLELGILEKEGLVWSTCATVRTRPRGARVSVATFSVPEVGFIQSFNMRLNTDQIYQFFKSIDL